MNASNTDRLDAAHVLDRAFPFSMRPPPPVRSTNIRTNRNNENLIKIRMLHRDGLFAHKIALTKHFITVENFNCAHTITIRLQSGVRVSFEKRIDTCAIYIFVCQRFSPPSTTPDYAVAVISTLILVVSDSRAKFSPPYSRLAKFSQQMPIDSVPPNTQLLGGTICVSNSCTKLI